MCARYAVADAFAAGALKAKEAGFDMVMIHRGHGWFLHQFIPPITNHRTDQWGGAMKNRMRFPLLVVEKVRDVLGPKFLIDIRISGTEYADELGGYGLDTGVEIAEALDGKVDLIHVSANTNEMEHGQIMMHPMCFQNQGHNGYLAAEIRMHVRTPVCSVGAWSHPRHGEVPGRERGEDCLAMGKALIADAILPEKILYGKPEEIRPCIWCGERQSNMISNGVMRCTVNPMIGREDEFFHPILSPHKRKVLISGGGLGGMQAALEAKVCGHKVVLCETTDPLGA